MATVTRDAPWQPPPPLARSGRNSQGSLAVPGSGTGRMVEGSRLPPLWALPSEICSTPRPTVSPNISNHHRPAAPCPHHQSVPAPAPLINDDLCRRDRGLGDVGDTGQEKGTGVGGPTIHVVPTTPQCPGTAGPRLQFKKGRRKRLSAAVGGGGGVGGFGLVTFKFRGSGAGSHTAPAGNVTLSDVSGQAKYNLVSTWKDVL
ncbi:hypothetical protein EYF80_000122 [Liparis tanakae]|uniref:Uncharacterized protein n=1 Tax=Liparis tanakae TaxID=230148 RepID=A0A4Z2JGU1_9TELE|nr:hypothetical protein EYF80_000122 [Liparis tanakae]